jgi:hypothetical protein
MTGHFMLWTLETRHLQHSTSAGVEIVLGEQLAKIGAEHGKCEKKEEGKHSILNNLRWVSYLSPIWRYYYWVGG